MSLEGGQDDVFGYKSNNAWLKNHPAEALIFKNLPDTWKDMSVAYERDFRAMVFGDGFPNAQEIFQTLEKIKTRLIGLQWTVVIGDAEE